jgi:hypothetical protein
MSESVNGLNQSPLAPTVPEYVIKGLKSSMVTFEWVTPGSVEKLGLAPGRTGFAVGSVELVAGLLVEPLDSAVVLAVAFAEAGPLPGMEIAELMVKASTKLEFRGVRSFEYSGSFDSEQV